MVAGLPGRHVYNLKFILNVLVIVLVQLYYSGFVYAVTQSDVAGGKRQSDYVGAVDQSFPKAKIKKSNSIQQERILLARNCRTVRVYRRKCRTRYIKRRRCKNYRTVKRICKRKPVQRKVCSVRTVRVRRCRGPLGQQECKVIAKRKRTCAVRTVYATSCKNVQSTTRRCRQIRSPRKICHRKVYRKRRCSRR